jgi:hypothetical protein
MQASGCGGGWGGEGRKFRKVASKGQLDEMETYDGPAWRLISTLCGESATRSLGSFHAYVWGWIRWDVPTVYYKYAKQTWHCRGALSLPTLSSD